MRLLITRNKINGLNEGRYMRIDLSDVKPGDILFDTILGPLMVKEVDFNKPKWLQIKLELPDHKDFTFNTSYSSIRGYRSDGSQAHPNLFHNVEEMIEYFQKLYKIKKQITRNYDDLEDE